MAQPSLLLHGLLDSRLKPVMSEYGYRYAKSYPRFSKKVRDITYYLDFQKSKWNSEDHCEFWTFWGLKSSKFEKWLSPVNSYLGYESPRQVNALSGSLIFKTDNDFEGSPVSVVNRFVIKVDEPEPVRADFESEEQYKRYLRLVEYLNSEEDDEGVGEDAFIEFCTHQGIPFLESYDTDRKILESLEAEGKHVKILNFLIWRNKADAAFKYGLEVRKRIENKTLTMSELQKSHFEKCIEFYKLKL